MTRTVLTCGGTVGGDTMCRQRVTRPVQGMPSVAQSPCGRTQSMRSPCVASGMAMVPAAHRDVVTHPVHRMGQSVDSPGGYAPLAVQRGESSGSRT